MRCQKFLRNLTNLRNLKSQRGIAAIPIFILAAALFGTLLGTVAVQKQTRTEGQAAGVGKYEPSGFGYKKIEGNILTVQGKVCRKKNRSAGNERITLYARPTSDFSSGSWQGVASYTDYSGSSQGGGADYESCSPIGTANFTVTDEFVNGGCEGGRLEWRITVDGAKDSDGNIDIIVPSENCSGTPPTTIPTEEPEPTEEVQPTEPAEPTEEPAPTDEPAEEIICDTVNDKPLKNCSTISNNLAPLDNKKPAITSFTYDENTYKLRIEWNAPSTQQEVAQYRIAIADKTSGDIWIGWGPDITDIVFTNNTYYESPPLPSERRGHTFEAIVRAIYKTGETNTQGTDCVCRSNETRSEGLPTQPAEGEAQLEGVIMWGGDSRSTGTSVREGKVTLKRNGMEDIEVLTNPQNPDTEQCSARIACEQTSVYTIENIEPCQESEKCYTISAQGYKNDNPDRPDDSNRFGTSDPTAINIKAGSNEFNIFVHDERGQGQCTTELGRHCAGVGNSCPPPNEPQASVQVGMCGTNNPCCGTPGQGGIPAATAIPTEPAEPTEPQPTTTVGFTCPSGQVCSSIYTCPADSQNQRGCSGDTWSVCCDSSVVTPTTPPQATQPPEPSATNTPVPTAPPEQLVKNARLTLAGRISNNTARRIDIEGKICKAGPNVDIMSCPREADFSYNTSTILPSQQNIFIRLSTDKDALTIGEEYLVAVFVGDTYKLVFWLRPTEILIDESENYIPLGDYTFKKTSRDSDAIEAQVQTPQDRCDVDGDGVCSARDYDLVVRAYGTSWDAGAQGVGAGGSPDKDVNLDGVVNGVDLSIIISNIGQQQETPQTQTSATGVRLFKED